MHDMLVRVGPWKAGACQLWSWSFQPVTSAVPQPHAREALDRDGDGGLRDGKLRVSGFPPAVLVW